MSKENKIIIIAVIINWLIIFIIGCYIYAYYPDYKKTRAIAAEKSKIAKLEWDLLKKKKELQIEKEAEKMILTINNHKDSMEMVFKAKQDSLKRVFKAEQDKLKMQLEARLKIKIAEIMVYYGNEEDDTFLTEEQLEKLIW